MNVIDLDFSEVLPRILPPKVGFLLSLLSAQAGAVVSKEEVKGRTEATPRFDKTCYRRARSKGGC